MVFARRTIRLLIMIVYIHLQSVDYVDCVLAMQSLMHIYNLKGIYRNMTPPHFPTGEYLYMYTPSEHDGAHLQNFIEWISTRRFCKDISVE